MHALARLGLMALLLAQGVALATDGRVHCTDADPPFVGCPDLLVDRDRLQSGITLGDRTFAATECAVQEGYVSPGTRRLLRLSFEAQNLGKGDLQVGVPSNSSGWWTWQWCHHHFHFRDFAHYRLWTPDGFVQWMAARAADPSKNASEVFAAHPGLKVPLVNGTKASFCLVDVHQIVTGLFSPHYFGCHAGQAQGISLGWADVYHSGLDGQWIDITGVDAGSYVLEAEVNPERVIDEESYANNAAAVLVSVPAAG